MQHPADVGLVDAHAEGDGGHHDQPVLALEPRLDLPPRLGLQPRVIGHRRVSRLGQRLRQRFGPRPAGAINDPRLPAPGRDETHHLLARAVLGLEGQPQVGPVEAAQKGHGGLAVEQARDDLGPGFHVRRGGEGRQRHVQRALEIPDAQVVGAEVVTPLADAMRLVHGDGGHARAPQQGQRPARGQPFRRHVEKLQLAPRQGPEHGVGFLVGVAAGQRARRHPRLAQRAHLVAHQGDQRGYDHRHPVPHQRGQLEAQRLAAARGHDRQHVAAPGHGLDDLLLAGAETVEAPDLSQQVPRHHIP